MLNQSRYIIIASCIFLVTIFLVTDPIPQDLAYHQLADHRHWLGMPNFANVLSNLPFAIVGVLGLFLDLKESEQSRLSWQIFFYWASFGCCGLKLLSFNPK